MSRPARPWPGSVLLGLALVLLLPQAGDAARRRIHEPPGRQTFTSPQERPLAVSPDGSLLVVAATTSNQANVIDTAQNKVLRKIGVGIDPVAVAFRPDGLEVWVANHVSDSVSVIDMNSANDSYLRVVETVQDLSGGVTRFDEPVGIAFKGDGSQAYVALSSRNDVAIVDTTSYQVTGRVHITNQEPRALAVSGDRLFVLAFESGNRSQLSACEELGQDDHCTLDAEDLGEFVTVNPNIPSQVKDIVIDDDTGYPDRDLFVFDIGSGLADGAPPQDVVEDVGTLLYGLVVGHQSDTVFVTQADARNAENGAHLALLADLDNRMFLNQITEVDCTGGGGNPCSTVTRHDLEEAPGQTVSLPLATPYGVDIDAGDNLLVATAAASSRIFSWDVNNGSGPGKVLDSLDVGAIPRGIVLSGSTAYVLNTLGNSVSVVSVDTNPASGTFGDFTHVTDISVGNDPTADDVRLGRIAFNDANASSSGTFSCASCHPDGNTDQLLWRIGGDCQGAGCPAGDEPRTTMPVRGLRDTVPLHWDGTLADPFGGPDGSDPDANKSASQTAGGATCSLANQHACFRHLVEASLTGVMCDQGSCPSGPTGDGGLLTDTERTNMAIFLESVSYPPARSRSADDAVTTTGIDGFQDFFMDDPEFRGWGGIFNAVDEPETCADSTAGCHEFPLGTASNAEVLGAFEAPTMRGMTDRWLQFSMGITGSQEMLVGANDGIDLEAFLGFPIHGQPQAFGTWTDGLGFEEDFTFGVAFGVFNLVYGGSAITNFQMFEEASTGYSGALGRQVTINSVTAAGAPSSAADAILDDLELADERGLVNLRGGGMRDTGHGLKPLTVSYDPPSDPTNPYRVGATRMSRAAMLAEAQLGSLLATLTANLREGTTESSPVPLVSVPGANCGTPALPNTQAGDPRLPIIHSGNTVMALETKYIGVADEVLVDGAPVGGATITLTGSTPVCGSDSITPDEVDVDLNTSSFAVGPHLLQIRAGGLLSNELPFIVQ